MKRLMTAAALWLAVACSPAASAAVIINALSVPMNLRDDFFGSYEPIDIDANGTTDFTFGYNFQSVGLRTEGGNRAIIRLVGTPTIGGRLTPLESDYSIASILTPTGFDDREWASSDYLGGFVSPGENAFLSIVFAASTGSSSDFNGRGAIGIEFEAADGIHYGYLDIEAGPGYAGITLYGWAYESQPNTPIFAGSVPEPSRMLLLLVGTFALICRRSRRQTELH
jgi:hypothetical protein